MFCFVYSMNFTFYLFVKCFYYYIEFINFICILHVKPLIETELKQVWESEQYGRTYLFIIIINYYLSVYLYFMFINQHLSTYIIFIIYKFLFLQSIYISLFMRCISSKNCILF